MLDFVSSVALFVIPRWVKVTLVVMLGGLTLLYLLLMMWGVYDADRPGWLEAGAYVFGIVLPFLLLSLLVGFGGSGIDALIGRNAEFLRHTVPKLAVLLADPPGNFEEAGRLSHSEPATPPKVMVQSAANMGIASYIVVIDTAFAKRLDGFPKERTLHFRIELNATKANVLIMLPRNRCKASPRDIFPHSLEGADKEHYDLFEHYWQETRLGREYNCIVAVRRLPDDFLVNPVKRLDFAHDLMMMLRAMLRESPDIFVEEKQQARDELE